MSFSADWVWFVRVWLALVWLKAMFWCFWMRIARASLNGWNHCWPAFKSHERAFWCQSSMSSMPKTSTTASTATDTSKWVVSRGTATSTGSTFRSVRRNAYRKNVVRRRKSVRHIVRQWPAVCSPWTASTSGKSAATTRKWTDGVARTWKCHSASGNVSGFQFISFWWQNTMRGWVINLRFVFVICMNRRRHHWDHTMLAGGPYFQRISSLWVSINDDDYDFCSIFLDWLNMFIASRTTETHMASIPCVWRAFGWTNTLISSSWIDQIWR